MAYLINMGKKFFKRNFRNLSENSILNLVKM